MIYFPVLWRNSVVSKKVFIILLSNIISSIPKSVFEALWYSRQRERLGFKGYVLVSVLKKPTIISIHLKKLSNTDVFCIDMIIYVTVSHVPLFLCLLLFLQIKEQGPDLFYIPSLIPFLNFPKFCFYFSIKYSLTICGAYTMCQDSLKESIISRPHIFTEGK